MRLRGEGRGESGGASSPLSLLPSPDRALRAVALLGLAWLTWGAFAEPRPAGSVSIDDISLRALADWTVRPRADTLHVALRDWPAPGERDWLRALAAAGHAVTWSHGGWPATAIEQAPVPGPGGEVTVRVAAPRGRRVSVGDSLGVLDSVTVTGSGAAVRAAAPVGVVTVSVDGHVATAAPRSEWSPRRAVVLGTAGWEAKFVIAALEEKGWEVDARLAVAPDVAVTQGAPFPLDTARHGVVIALDSAAARAAAALVGFVRQGGGVVIAPGPLRGELARVAPAAWGARVRPATLTFVHGDPRRALGFVALASLQEGAVPLETREERVAVAARRVGVGRIVQLGYEDTWRWRMAGGDAGPEQHRAWWSSLASAAAYRSVVPAEPPPTDPVPLASLVAALGPPADASPAAGRAPRPGWPIVLSIVFAALFGEWLLRRLRGRA